MSRANSPPATASPQHSPVTPKKICLIHIDMRLLAVAAFNQGRVHIVFIKAHLHLNGRGIFRDPFASEMVVEYQKKHSEKITQKLSRQDIESIQTVASYLGDHYASDISLERLTQIACMGTTKLKSCFKKYYDCTITEYIQQRRMSQAEYLLAYTDLSVGQIAQTIGYSTSSRFAELFRKSTGLLPMEYRKMAQKNKNLP